AGCVRERDAASHAERAASEARPERGARECAGGARSAASEEGAGASGCARAAGGTGGARRGRAAGDPAEDATEEPRAASLAAIAHATDRRAHGEGEAEHCDQEGDAGKQRPGIEGSPVSEL